MVFLVPFVKPTSSVVVADDYMVMWSFEWWPVVPSKNSTWKLEHSDFVSQGKSNRKKKIEAFIQIMLTLFSTGHFRRSTPFIFMWTLEWLFLWLKTLWQILLFLFISSVLQKLQPGIANRMTSLTIYLGKWTGWQTFVTDMIPDWVWQDNFYSLEFDGDRCRK